MFRGNTPRITASMIFTRLPTAYLLPRERESISSTGAQRPGHGCTSPVISVILPQPLLDSMYTISPQDYACFTATWSTAPAIQETRSITPGHYTPGRQLPRRG